ncbi:MULTISPECIES: PadR family transcriptional regulator [Bacillaceae]|uniref:PadR family transcriptional regulator n=1 Tax=Evansella alkalicola TaxID=745819 RepID=A0ABS6JYZ5_9BACI|nr:MULTISPECIES: helix-turn-helix transcriptional regulator [Bacillaceae]MBU9722427.1 PadR family transcriptional regulator [Bacillus alkalicola]
MEKNKVDEIILSLMQEMRRGTIIIGVLSQLSKPQYGYSLVAVLGGKGIQVEPNTLYPLLRRLEKQGLLESQWDTNETRPRKYYVRSTLGEEVYDQLCVEWGKMVQSMSTLLKDEGGEDDGSN